jgi:hypothetical protein
MSIEQGYRLVTRTFVAFFLFWIFADALALPHEFLGLMHHIHLLFFARQMGKYIDDESYWLRYYIISCSETGLQIVIYFWLAGWFYRGSPALRRFFIAAQD